MTQWICCERCHESNGPVYLIGDADSNDYMLVCQKCYEARSEWLGNETKYDTATEGDNTVIWERQSP